MKTAPVMAARRAGRDAFEQLLVHTGQHYDDEMSEVFFRDLGMPAPDRYPRTWAAGRTPRRRRAIMIAFEPVVRGAAPDWVVVVGDVNSTVACALVVRQARRARGARRGGPALASTARMPEEINRLVTDQLADLLLTPSRDADAQPARGRRRRRRRSASSAT